MVIVFSSYKEIFSDELEKTGVRKIAPIPW